MSLNKADSLATTGLGRVTGPAAAFQISSWKSFTPASARLGKSGTRALRPAEVTPIALSLPARICAMARPGGNSDRLICPPSMAEMTCGLPG